MIKEQFLAKWVRENPRSPEFPHFSSSDVLNIMEAYNTHVREKEKSFYCADLEGVHALERCKTQCLRCIEIHA